MVLLIVIDFNVINVCLFLVDMEESSSHEPIFIIKPPLNTTVKSGETIQWECAVSSRDANVFWRRQGNGVIKRFVSSGKLKGHT